MSVATKLNAFWWCWARSPEKAIAPLYRLVRKHKPRKLMVLGLGDTVRPLRLIALANVTVRQTLSNLRASTGLTPDQMGQPRLSLKKTHQLLRPTAARISLLPGDPQETLPRAANTLHGIELVGNCPLAEYGIPFADLVSLASLAGSPMPSCCAKKSRAIRPF